MGEDFDAQTMLDQYIYNYLVNKNLRYVAEIFAMEANFQPQPVAADGLLSDWWSIFSGIYCSRSGNNPTENQASTSMPHQSCASLRPNSRPEDPNYMLQNICPSMTSPGCPDQHLRPLPSVEEPFSLSPEDCMLLEKLLNQPQSDNPMPEMGSLLSQRPEMKSLPPWNIDFTLRPQIPMMVPRPEMGSLLSQRNLDPEIKAIESPVLTFMREMESLLPNVEFRNPPWNVDPAIKAPTDFTLRPEMGSLLSQRNLYPEIKAIDLPLLTFMREMESLPTDFTLRKLKPRPEMESLPSDLSQKLQFRNPLRNTVIIPQTNFTHRPEMGSSSYRMERAKYWKQKRPASRAPSTGTGLRRPTTLARTPPAPERIQDTGSPGDASSCNNS